MRGPVIKLAAPPRRRAGAQFALPALVLLLAAPVLAVAQQPLSVERPVRFRVAAWPDGVVIAAGAVGATLPIVLGERLPTASCAACDPSHLWGIDRSSVGIASAGLSTVSDVALAMTVGGSALLVAATRRGESDADRAAFEDAVVMARVAAVDAFLAQWLKVALHRPRPERYTSQGAQFTSVDDSRSFPSEHTSFAFAAAAAAASILQRRGELHRHRAEAILLFAAAAATAALRVAAHQHFPTDVAAGAVLGAAVGWTLPRLQPLRW